MTIKETVKRALTAVQGNKPFTANEMVLTIPRELLGDLLDYTPVQINRALRDIPYVKRLPLGRYMVKGRRVPPKVDITQSEIGN